MHFLSLIISERIIATHEVKSDNWSQNMLRICKMFARHSKSFVRRRHMLKVVHRSGTEPGIIRLVRKPLTIQPLLLVNEYAVYISQIHRPQSSIESYLVWSEFDLSRFRTQKWNSAELFLNIFLTVQMFLTFCYFTALKKNGFRLWLKANNFLERC